MSGNATIDCLRHKPRHVVDSGYSTDGVDKRWSNDGEYNLLQVFKVLDHKEKGDFRLR